MFDGGSWTNFEATRFGKASDQNVLLGLTTPFETPSSPIYRLNYDTSISYVP